MPAPETIATWLLVGVRVVALCVAAPVFGHTAVPVRVRVGLALAIATAMTPALAAPSVAPDAPAAAWVMAAAGEVLVGIALGFAAKLVFDALGLLGGFVSVQGGLGAASVVDPASGAASTAFSALFEAVAVLVWLAIDGPALLLRGLAGSFAVVPLGAGGPGAASWAAVAGLGAGFFEIAVQLAAPVTVAMLVANLLLGVVGRAMPEVNLMALQLPAHVLLVLVLLVAVTTPLGDALARTLAAWTAAAAGVLGGGP